MGSPVLFVVLATSLSVAQLSATCQFAIASWLATQIEVQEAQRALRECRRAGSFGCKSEEARIQTLDQRLRLLRNYLERYCSR